MKWDAISADAYRQLENDKLHKYLGDVIGPFHPYYRRLFAAHQIDPRDIRSVADLARIPFTSKTDLLSTPEQPEKFREFVVTPDLYVLKHRPRVIAEALCAPRRTEITVFAGEVAPVGDLQFKVPARGHG